MRIAALETLHADVGRRAFDFVKVTTDDGLVGWSEYNEAFGGSGLTTLIDPETVPWQDELVTRPPRIEAGHLLLPTGPGWGTGVDEATVRAHPPRTSA
jgi:L-alanine-DL-glutamate epimerase-like enolase superfamily enzyme